MTRRFKGHPIGVAKELRKIRTRDEQEQRCIVSLLCGLTDSEFEDATKVEAVYFVDLDRKNHCVDRLTVLEMETANA
jgi:hypothetical protein